MEDPEADAERLSYIIRSARKLDRTADVRPYLDQLAQQHPDSLWRLDALIVVANQANTDNEPATFLPLYQACAAGFPTDPRSAWCHWRLAFTAYWQNKPDAFDLLREQVQRYPDSEDANAALYYLGRFSESRGDTAAARAYFSEMARLFPNTYYAVIGRERLKDAKIAASAPDPAVMEFIQSIPFPVRVTSPSFVPDKDTQKRLERAKLLETADLLDWAESELKFGAHNDGEQPQIYAYELAKLAAAQSEPDQAVRYIKAFAPGYLSYSSSAVPLDFWHLAFPMPYRAAMERDSRENELDPFLVAALIRQESEFNARVISYANAYGLMQVMPATGRELARRLKIKSFRTSDLLTPDRNMQLGTYYFRSLLNQLNGEAVFALAAYNAGKSRVDQWRQRGTFHEPSEFIETIPFDQTRTYVQVVLRNADVYRRFYAGTQADPTPQKETPEQARGAGEENHDAHQKDNASRLELRDGPDSDALSKQTSSGVQGVGDSRDDPAGAAEPAPSIWRRVFRTLPRQLKSSRRPSRPSPTTSTSTPSRGVRSRFATPSPITIETSTSLRSIPSARSRCAAALPRA